MHEQEPALFLSLQIAFGPHGDGLHGSLGTSAGGGAKIGKSMLQFVCIYISINCNDNSNILSY